MHACWLCALLHGVLGQCVRYQGWMGAVSGHSWLMQFGPLGHVCGHVQLTRFGSIDNSALGGSHLMTVDHPVACVSSSKWLGFLSFQAR
jgi:hypothetical protein